MSPIDLILNRVSNVKKVGNGYMANCPNPDHADRNPSLSINETEDGKALLHCFGGCPLDAVLAALELSMSDLFTKKGNGSSFHSNNTATLQRSPGCTLEEYCLTKRLQVEFIKGLGCSDIVYMGAPAMRMPYYDPNGQEGPVRYRVALNKGESGDQRFRWRKSDKPCLYGLERLNSKHDYVVLVEGESDCHTLWFHNISALGVPGAGNWREERDAHHLDGVATIYVVVEPDSGGEAVKNWLSKSKIRDRVKLVSLGGGVDNNIKDPSCLHVADPERFHERFQAGLDAAIPWTERAEQEAEAQRQEAWGKCSDLAKHKRILDTFADTLHQSGVVGVRKFAQLIFLILITRLLKRPVSLAVKGPSSGGKSFLVECVLRYFPEFVFYALSAMSERALAYSDEPLKHRFLVIYEANGMEGEMQSYLIRSLLSEGFIRYETVEKTKDGLVAKLIVREGPTGLIVTTTASYLHPENETRLVSFTVTDTPQQTKDILAALADERTVDVDLTLWQALQSWLQSGPHAVTIPYAQVLALRIPPLAVRLRRDFGAVLNLIRAHAILHQATRDFDPQGRIIATIDDYAVVRELVGNLIAEGIDATVSTSVRETVEAVEKILKTGATEVSVARLAQELHLDKASASRRVRAAVDRGFVTNLESKRGLPSRLVLGDPLPAEQPILPTAEALLTCCSANGRDMHPPPLPENEKAGEEEPVYPPEYKRNGATPPLLPLGRPLHRCSENGGSVHPPPLSPTGCVLSKDAEVF